MSDSIDYAASMLLSRFKHFVAAALIVLSGPLAAGAEEVSMEDRCRREVVELHRFFQDWFNAELANDAASYARFDGVLAEDFEIIGPTGNRTERAAVVGAVRSVHGRSVEQPVAIEVRDVRSRTVGDGLVLVTYEEHQTLGDTHRGWLSSALFRAREGRPNGVEWLHVQETYLPGLSGD